MAAACAAARAAMGAAALGACCLQSFPDLPHPLLSILSSFCRCCLQAMFHAMTRTLEVPHLNLHEEVQASSLYAVLLLLLLLSPQRQLQRSRR